MMLQRRRATPSFFAALVLFGALSLALAPSAFAAAASPAGACSIGSHGRSLGPTYVTALSVSGGATCGGAEKLVKAYYKCRKSHGGIKGHCSSTSGYRCSEKRFAVIVVQYSAKVVCTRGHKVVRHTYTQFT